MFIQDQGQGVEDGAAAAANADNAGEAVAEGFGWRVARFADPVAEVVVRFVERAVGLFADEDNSDRVDEFARDNLDATDYVALAGDMGVGGI